MDQVKSRFFANISHEFRTPLTLIMSPIEQMLEDSEDKKRNKMLNLMLRNSHSLLTLINQLLDLARLDSRKMKLKAARQDIIPFLRGIFDGFRVPAEKKRQTLKFQTEEETVHLYFDAQKMEEVMNNLLMNAVSFTPSGGGIAVSVSLYRGDKEPEEPAEPGEKNDGLNKANLPEAKGTLDFVRLSVRDTGEGMSTEQLALIFDRFYQTGSSVTKGRKGTGIGLALTKELITLHHGKINVHSHEGKGTEFVILLPTGCNHLNATEITDSPASAFQPSHNFQRENLLNNHHQEDDAGEKDKPDTEIKKEPDTDSGIDTEDTVTAALTKKNDEQEKNVVLVVEDNADVRSYIRGPLQSLYTVVEACDGKEGIAKAKELIPDLIVSDIMMPEADGYELCRELKKDVKTSHIPIVLLTAKAAEESIIEGLGTGADDYVTKPFNTKILLSRIKNLIDLRRQLQLKIQREKMLLPSEISVSSVDNVFLKEFQGIIEKNLSDSEFQIMDMADLLFMSRSSLFRKIKAITGETPHQFLISYRLNRAAQFLKNHYGNITEIAMATGFASSAHFSKAFKKKFHQSPSSYQATESQNDPAASKQ
ncbi:MAG: response regulator [bacterium]|nr:response regulator [bacterium]